MSDKKPEKKTESHAADSGGGGGSNIKMFIIFGVIVLVMIVGSVAGTLYFTGFFSGGAGAGAGSEHQEEHAEKKEDFSKLPPNYLDLKPGFIANAIEEDNLHFVLAEISVMSRNPSVPEKVSGNLMGIRDAIRESLSGHLYIEVLGSTGIEKLRVAAETAVNDYLEHRHLPKIDALYFTSFVVQ